MKLTLISFMGLLLTLGCAGATSQVVDTRGMEKAVRPKILIVDLFDVEAEDVTVDESGPGFTSGDGSRAERSALGDKVAEALAEQIVVELKEKGIAAKRAKPGASPPASALVVRGQFVEIDEGDQMSRVVVGFGAGTESLAVRTQIYQVEDDGGLRRVREAAGEAHGDRMPGLAVPVGAGAAMGNVVVSAAVSGALNVLQEMNAGLASAAKNLAEQFAERAEKIYRDRGWLD